MRLAVVKISEEFGAAIFVQPFPKMVRDFLTPPRIVFLPVDFLGRLKSLCHAEGAGCVAVCHERRGLVAVCAEDFSHGDRPGRQPVVQIEDPVTLGKQAGHQSCGRSKSVHRIGISRFKPGRLSRKRICYWCSITIVTVATEMPGACCVQQKDNDVRVFIGGTDAFQGGRLRWRRLLFRRISDQGRSQPGGTRIVENGVPFHLKRNLIDCVVASRDETGERNGFKLQIGIRGFAGKNLLLVFAIFSQGDAEFGKIIIF